ncbi:MarR family winged helix-turn-helix transcriptional regulator [Oceanobacter mangrovi]|uniref:MarR family winged helix-turn-helix transcriptional regulator n=1 Tax=Oceanobacter mangrovi TaxID=2862510 RepID=UPI001C8E6C32|nr:MarR family transcriptional regulator [Oceanobacter mangrovi]
MTTPASQHSKISSDSALTAESLAQDHLLLQQQICFPLYAVSNLVVKSYGPLLKPLGLTYPQYLVMLLLWQHQSLAVGELGKQLHLDSGTLTPLLKRMENNGLIKRQRSPADERRVLVSLTTAGMELRQAATAVPQAMACKLAADPQWLLQLQDNLNLLIGRLSQDDAGSGN